MSLRERFNMLYNDNYNTFAGHEVDDELEVSVEDYEDEETYVDNFAFIDNLSALAYYELDPYDQIAIDRMIYSICTESYDPIFDEETYTSSISQEGIFGTVFNGIKEFLKWIWNAVTFLPKQAATKVKELVKAKKFKEAKQLTETEGKKAIKSHEQMMKRAEESMKKLKDTKGADQIGKDLNKLLKKEDELLKKQFRQTKNEIAASSKETSKALDELEAMTRALDKDLGIYTQKLYDHVKHGKPIDRVKLNQNMKELDEIKKYAESLLPKSTKASKELKETMSKLRSEVKFSDKAMNMSKDEMEKFKEMYKARKLPKELEGLSPRELTARSNKMLADARKK